MLGNDNSLLRVVLIVVLAILTLPLVVMLVKILGMLVPQLVLIGLGYVIWRGLTGGQDHLAGSCDRGTQASVGSVN